MPLDLETDRRPLKIRRSRWSQQAANYLANLGITPNQISVTSIVFATIGASSMFFGPWFMLIAAMGIQGRLLCNLLDGMVAVEYKQGTALGPVYNEFPDRIADTILLVSAGYAIDIPTLGWLAALAAALTAYIRVFGASCGLGHNFRGPMAKQHRMAVLSVSCLLTPVLPFSYHTLTVGLALIALLSLITCLTRTKDLCKGLQQEPKV